MEPIQETKAALDELATEHPEGDDLRASLQDLAARVRELVPDCVGMSIAWRRHGVVLTLVATDDEIALLDAVQYALGGPCVQAIEAGERTDVRDIDVLDETAWQAFAELSAATAVRSSLTMPLLEDGSVVGTANLYAASRAAFDDQHDALAEVLGGWAPSAVTNADLSFRTREEAQRAPGVLKDAAVLAQATGMLAAHLGVGVDDAEAVLHDAALRAGVPVRVLAQALVRAVSGGGPGGEGGPPEVG
ncbi:GAF domain-containing protein [Nocardioides salarius]|uniref:GAF domain-containing protein n=1 Tax=Nocardioides salarius TaxID=374513 RepID=A0ABS2MFU1_9ACTN|nr:GAF and ANTAR domain-containing protein [Nocardioides salarius]MBM7510064.1 GAF domain-containing protein [Nocardioides salarius]